MLAPDSSTDFRHFPRLTLSHAGFSPLSLSVPTGASALDKKSKKAFEADQLARVGAKAAARPRVPANIGYGMAKKAAQREERALQEGIAGEGRAWQGVGWGLGLGVWVGAAAASRACIPACRTAFSTPPHPALNPTLRPPPSATPQPA